ncbi:MAG: hypothetical protein DI626_08000 [Micavibrio aeruginosavorus]|uniref:Uncharacterized protein n=1 Tax=Micavibrio aeruginosavorus TaxID=349221 RepID=A0A2W5BNL2_9BACT|nr:MAG: hypothetical protein DI626_08000 [Micavibrio aeruginosavorus]
MSNSAKLLCFLLLLPFFATIAHDFYASNKLNASNKMRLEIYDIDPKAYQASDFGYVLSTYTPAPFQMAKDMIGERDWNVWVDPVLRIYTFVIALIPAVIFFIWLVISRIFDIWPFAKDGGNSRFRDTSEPVTNRSDLTGRGSIFDKKNKQMTYKRR